MDFPSAWSSILEAAIRRSHVLKMGMFARESLKLWRDEPGSFDLSRLLRTYPAWDRSQSPGRSALAEKQPWITFAALRGLEQILRADMRVFEFGSGGSTLFFAKHVATGISVEHEEAWAARVGSALADAGISNWSVELHPPVPDATAVSRSPSDVDGYVSDDLQYTGRSFRDYATSIERFEDEYFDLVFLDGRARPSCFRHARSKVRVGGYLVVDNSDRPHYRAIHDALALASWERRHYHGPGPYTWGFWATTIWRRPR